MINKLYYILKQRIYESKNKNKPCQGKVYMFHDISNNNSLYSISKDNFLTFINWLKENKNIITIDELKNNLNKDNIVITFDDIFSSVYYDALPILKEKNIPYYIFVCDEFLDKEGFASKIMIEEMLKQSKCFLGCHRKKHSISRNISDNDLKNELIDIKNKYKKIFGIDIDSMAFPFGSMYACSKENIEVAANNFSNVLMTYRLPYNEEYKNIIPRININNSSFYEEMK